MRLPPCCFVPQWAALLKAQAELVGTLAPVLRDLPPAPRLPDREYEVQGGELEPS